MKSNTSIKLEDAVANARQYIAQMQQMDDKKLAKHLNLFREQMQTAYDQKNHIAFQLLAEYERQLIEARVQKNFSEQKK